MTMFVLLVAIGIGFSIHLWQREKRRIAVTAGPNDRYSATANTATVDAGGDGFDDAQDRAYANLQTTTPRA